MVCRKSTYCFVDFLLGKYSDKNAEYLKFMIKNMTYYERMAITTKTYEELWSDLYSNSRTPTGDSMNMYLKNSINHEIYLLFLIQHCHVNIDIQNGDFLKVDQTNQKTLSIVRSRELYEETRLNRSSYEIIRDILPFEERYVGTNGIGYRNVFFIGKANMNCIRYLDRNNTAQTREIGYIKWFPYEIAIKHFRDHEESKRCILKRVNDIVVQYHTNHKNHKNISNQDSIS